MDFLDLFRHFLILIVPGLIGALVYSIVACFRAEINLAVALVLDFLTFVIMITGLYLWHSVATVEYLIYEFNCLSFTRNYALLSLLITIVLAVIGGILRRLFFWIRR